jgi:hypothetical protein
LIFANLLRLFPPILSANIIRKKRQPFRLALSANLSRKKWKPISLVGDQTNVAGLGSSGHISSPVACVCSNLPLAVEAK